MTLETLMQISGKNMSQMFHRLSCSLYYPIKKTDADSLVVVSLLIRGTDKPCKDRLYSPDPKNLAIACGIKPTKGTKVNGHVINISLNQ